MQVIFSAPLELLPGVIVRVTTPIDSSNPDELVLWTCQSLLNQFQLSFSLNECLENGRFVLQRELVRRENKANCEIFNFSYTLDFFTRCWT